MPVIEKSSDGRQSLSVRRGDAYTNFSVPKRPGRAPNTGTHTKKRGEAEMGVEEEEGWR